jgi:uncharacterized protein YggE
MNVRLGHVALLAVFLLAGCASVAPSAPAERGIAVTGSGRVSLPPDTAVLELGAEARAAQLADATAEVDRRMRAVLAQVKAAGVREADVRTAGYTIDPIAESRPPGDPGVRIVGYRVSNVVNVRTRDVAGVGRVVDAAVTAGANIVRNVHFTLEEPTRAEAEARALAMQDAAEKARQIAAAAGLRLGRLVSVTESGPVRPVARMTMTTAMAPGPVEPGQLDVTITLEARYAIEY